MHTKDELLLLAGKLAIACGDVVNADVKTISNNVEEMKKALMNYNRAIYMNAIERDTNIKFE